MISSSSFLVSALQSAPISTELILQGTRHLNQTKRKNLFSANPQVHRRASGYLYESIIYEMIIRAVHGSEEISRVVLRRDDVPKKFRAIRPFLGQNGFYYSEGGEITIRGDGMDLGEFDSMALDSHGNLLSVEAMVSAKYIKGLVKEIHYKKYLLAQLFGRDPVFVIVSPDNIARTSEGSLLAHEGGCYLVQTAPFEESLNKLSLSEIQSYQPNSTNIFKGILARNLPVTKTFSYRRVHNETRVKLMNAIASSSNKEFIGHSVEEPLLARIVIGQLDKEAVKNLTETWNLTINGSRIDPRLITDRVNRVMLVLRLPELRPGLYFKSENPKAFVKFAPFKKDEFGCERIIFPWSTPYFFMMDNNHDNVSSTMMGNVMQYCLSDNVIGPNIKKRRPQEKPVIKNLFGMKW